jgi:hypothetical protein
MASDTHFLIPFASSTDPACQFAIKTLSLPNLTHFLKHADVVHTDQGDEFDFIPPHERVLGLSGQVVVTPCHWSVGIDTIRMENPSDLQLTDDESREFFNAIQPYFAGDGITLSYQSAQVWHASSPQFHDLPLASLDRAIGRNVDVWQPPASQSKRIRRLQNEMQMLLYTHKVNEAREARRLPTVNSFWLSRAVNSNSNLNLSVDFSLRESALCGDWQAWTDGWQAIDRKVSQQLLPAGQSGQASQLTLCGERHAISLAEHRPQSMIQKMTRLFQAKPTSQSVLESL